MERKITRTKGNRYCTVEIKLSEGRLSICGQEGRIERPASARKQALEYWMSYFEEDANTIKEMNERMGTNFRSARSAAKYVLDTDGQYHGLDAHEDDGKVYILESCGQIVDDVRKWFPEVEPLLPWHLNDLKAGCEHQEALGWGHGKTLALTKDELTEAQRITIEGEAERVCSEARQKEYLKRWAEIESNQFVASQAIRSAKGEQRVTLYDVESLHNRMQTHRGSTRRTVQDWLKEDIAKTIKPEVFDAAIYKDSLCCPCPVCGYRYGTQWLKRELPPEIIDLATNVLKTEE